jgi:uncharacterized protein (DUF1499 family)
MPRRARLAVALLAGLAAVSAAGLGVRDGRLAPCPATPNCVSSQATDAEHAIAPLAYTGAPEAARERLKQVVAAMPRTRLVTERDGYLHYEFTSLIFRFVDDVEFWFDARAPVVQVRSASRVGRSDWGVNRRRVEQVRARFAQASGGA